MRRIITIAIVVAAATITTAWSVSTSSGGQNRGAEIRGGGGAAFPVHGPLLW